MLMRWFKWYHEGNWLGLILGASFFESLRNDNPYDDPMINLGFLIIIWACIFIAVVRVLIVLGVVDGG